MSLHFYYIITYCIDICKANIVKKQYYIYLGFVFLELWGHFLVWGGTVDNSVENVYKYCGKEKRVSKERKRSLKKEEEI